MATTLEIIQGLAQAAANAYDGAYDDDGNLLELGMRREDGDINLDKRTLDGFNVVFYGNKMCLTYESEVKLREVYGKGFETEIEQRLADITKYLKKEYRKIMGSSVSLTEEGEVDILVQTMGRHRSWVNAKKHYTLSGVEGVAPILEPSENRVDKSWKTFLEQGGWKGKRPKNDTRPKNSGK
jgi:hypothetical protein